MGEINLTAIDEHAELTKRFDFLRGPEEGPERRWSSCEEAIRRIDATSRERFKQTFDVVNEKFQAIFPRLFGGGRASLVLTEEGPGRRAGRGDRRPAAGQEAAEREPAVRRREGAHRGGAHLRHLAYHFCGHIYTTDSCPHPTGLPRDRRRSGYPLRAKDGKPVDDLGRLVDRDGQPVDERRQAAARPRRPAAAARAAHAGLHGDRPRATASARSIDGAWYRCCGGQGAQARGLLRATTSRASTATPR